VRYESMEVSKKERHEPVIIKIMDYDNLEFVLSKMIIPFSEMMRDSHVPDVYAGHEKIPFEKRYPLYQTIMNQEFADEIRVLKTGEM